MARRASINPEIQEFGSIRPIELQSSPDLSNQMSSQLLSPARSSRIHSTASMHSDDGLPHSPSRSRSQISSSFKVPELSRRLSVLGRQPSTAAPLTDLKRGSISMVDKLRQSLGGPIEEAYPADFVRAPTYAMKIVIDLTPPHKSPIVLNVVKGSTVNAVTRNVLKKYAAALNLDLSSLPHISNTAFFGPALPWIPSPLPLQKQDIMKDRLMELRVPYPFIVTISLDPVYVEKLKLEEEEKKRQMELEEERKVFMELLMVKLFELEVKEFEHRETVARRWLIELEPTAGSVLRLVEAEFNLVIMLQAMKEEEERRDAINDKIFFENLRLRNEELAKTHTHTSVNSRRSHLEKLQHGLATKWEAQYHKIVYVESAVRARLHMSIQEQLQRGIINWMAETELTVLLGIHEEQFSRRALIEKEARAYSQWKNSETESRLAIVAKQFHINEKLQRERHNSTLQRILSPILNSNREELIEKYMKRKPMRKGLDTSATEQLQSFFSREAVAASPTSAFMKTEAYGPTSMDLWGSSRQHVNTLEVSQWETELKIQAATLKADGKFMERKHHHHHRKPKIRSSDDSEKQHRSKSELVVRRIQGDSLALPLLSQAHAHPSPPLPAYSSITSAAKVAPNYALKPTLYPYTAANLVPAATVYSALGLALHPLCSSQRVGKPGATTNTTEALKITKE